MLTRLPAHKPPLNLAAVLLVVLLCALAGPSPPRAEAKATKFTAAYKKKTHSKAKKKASKRARCKTGSRRKVVKGKSRCLVVKRRATVKNTPVRGRPAPAAGLTPLQTAARPEPALPVASVVTPPTASTDRSIERPFAPNSFWNTPLRAGAPLDSKSGTYVDDVQQQLTRWLPWINTTSYSSPVYTVPADQPTVRVKLDYAYAPDLQSAMTEVPIPADAVAAGGTDKTMVVWQPSTDTMWEFWQAGNRSDGRHAAWGGRMQHVSSNPGYFDQPRNWGATATSLPMLGGLIRLDEMKSGVIDHALAICLPQTRSDWHSWPAQRTDGTVNDADAVPEGTRFRLNPDLDLSKIPMSRTTRMIAMAAQKYGMVVRDRGDAIAFYAEDPAPTGSNPSDGADGYFSGRYPSQLLEQFPWAHLQALQGSLSHG